MPLWGHNMVMRLLENYRIMWISGRFGGGKTSLAFRIAHDLMLTVRYRYLLSNVNSVWCDDLASVSLRDGRYVDAVLILDEAGEFIASASDARQWLSYLRKLNIILILPSFSSPAPSLKLLRTFPLFDLSGVGLSHTFYRTTLESGDFEEKISFAWFNTHEIWGVYDTDGFPSEASELRDAVKGWTSQAAKTLGYSKTASKYTPAIINFGDGSLVAPAPAPAVSPEDILDLQSAVDDMQAATKQNKRVLDDLNKLRRKIK